MVQLAQLHADHDPVGSRAWEFQLLADAQRVARHYLAAAAVVVWVAVGGP